MDTKGNFGSSYDHSSNFGTNFENNIENFDTIENFDGDPEGKIFPEGNEGRETFGHNGLQQPWTYAGDEARTQLFTAQLLDMAMRRASIVVNGVLIPKDKDNIEHRAVQKVLLDTGAIGASFVGASWIEAHEHLVLARKPLPEESEVTLADKTTKMRPKEKVLLRIQLPNSRGEWVEKLIWFYAMEAQMQIIVGLHDIQDHYLELFVDLLRAGAEARAKARHVRTLDKIQVDLENANVDRYYIGGWSGTRKYIDYIESNAAFDPDLVEPKEGDLCSPWSNLDAEAPELQELENPVNFPDFHEHMSMSSIEIDEQYGKEIQQHVNDDMMKKTKIMDLLSGEGRKAFIHDGKWEGIKGLESLPNMENGLELNWKEDLIKGLKRSKIRARPIADHLFEVCKAEMDRLRGYLYVDSESEISSPLVVAPKATPPYVRFCGDYVQKNKLLQCPQGSNVNVRDKVAKIKGYSYFGEFDMKNAFHQIKLAERTSNLLSVTTPWGCVRPKFLPEGVSPASIELQKVVDFLFGDMDFVVAIFDNLLVCAETQEELYERVEAFLNRCIKHNVVLKMSKSNIGFTEVEFFGYNIKKDYYELTEERKAVINDIPFPQATTQMRSFLGACLFFQSFVPNYAQLAAPLNDMIRNDFVWDQSKWTRDYEDDFRKLKAACNASFKLAFPDFSKRWILRTDASKVGCGGVLLQEEEVEDEKILRPVFFVSRKFSSSAQNWSTIQQEAYGIYYTMHKLQDYLMGKYFEVETDHNNLRWIEASLNPAIVRMRIFMQGYHFDVRHIPGKLNIAADYLSRYHIDKESTTTADATTANIWLNELSPLYMRQNEAWSQFELVANALTSTERHQAAWFGMDSEQSSKLFATLAVMTRSQAKREDKDVPFSADLPGVHDHNEEEERVGTPIDDTDFSSLTPQELIALVHNGKKGHWGAYRTWVTLNDTFPGHGIPFRTVQEFVQHCPICQKFNHPMRHNKLRSQYRTIKSMIFRKAIGIDHVTITPTSEGEYGGYKGITVLVNLFSGHAELYPYKESTAMHDAICLHDYMSRYGRFDEIRTDPGTDFKSKILEQLNEWYGITHIFSLVDRHESNGAERVIQEVTRHLSALVNDKRVVTSWAQPEYISSVRLLCNSTPLSERGGYSAHDLQFGTHDQPYFTYGYVKNKKSWSGIVKRIHQSMAAVRDASKDYQMDLAKKRGQGEPEANLYQVGDFVLAEKRTKMNTMKLMPRYLGPYEVLSQYKNDVKCRHMASSEVIEYHVDELHLFVGTRAEAEEASLLDNDLHYIDTILAHKGDPHHRTSMQFLIRWADGEIKWDRWNTSKDNFSKTKQFGIYISRYPELRRLAYTHSEWAERESQINTRGAFEGIVNDTFYHDMESYGTQWFQGLDLPGVPEQRYYSQIKVIKREGNHLVVQDMDIPTSHSRDEEYWLRPSDVMNLANRTLPDNGRRISSNLVNSKNIVRP